MIICPSCSNHELEGAIFCRECGTQLIGGARPAALGHKGKNTIIEGYASSYASGQVIRENPFPHALLTLKLFKDGAFIPIQNEGDIILGRIGDGQSVVPDIDLTKYHAREAGVSRLHAELRISRTEALIIDLGSSNGTMINDRRIQAHVLHSLHDGDTVSLGKLRFEVIISR